MRPPLIASAHAVVLGAAVVAGLCPGLTGCATGDVVYNYQREPDPRGQEFVVGIADVLRVNVWGQDNLSVEIAVRPDGKITLPLIGDVDAAGHTAGSIRQEIESRVESFVKGANVTVAVVSIQSYRFTVSGNVMQPGQFGAANYVTVLDAVALAGGVTRFAKLDKVAILRNYGVHGYRKIPINFEKLQMGERPDQNLVLLPGDNLVVP